MEGTFTFRCYLFLDLAARYFGRRKRLKKELLNMQMPGKRRWTDGVVIRGWLLPLVLELCEVRTTTHTVCTSLEFSFFI